MIEREFKSQITAVEYDKLIEKYNLSDSIYWQINYYFDTFDYALKKEGYTLRIRQKEKNIHLTLKTKLAEGVEEKTLDLTPLEASQMIAYGFSSNLVDLDKYVYSQASLKTYRAKFKYEKGVIFIDKNEYNGLTDYEIEYEIDDDITLSDGEKMFYQFLKENDLEFRKQISKSKRAIETKSL